MSKKKKSGQWDHYEKWTSDEGYTFLAENEKDAVAMEGEEKDILISMGFTDPTVQGNVSK